MTYEIQDLDFWEVQDNSKPVLGGFYSQVNAVANTGFNFASAGVETIALGEKTATWSTAQTNVINTSFSTNSYAKASGFAHAQTGGHSSTNEATAISYSGFVNYVQI
ncbi:hypothetical protein [Leptolyngbya sp. 7M]|uniref:hypothetical protein n=1 Tax=Leptolyngbya sp. 7M TaxID=2812896 RepID=UPI001B8A9AC2|nr:hypothetical protein [Leptolyngbya sp. 7M]QYO62009.1 hypothetical protein JVX88_17950 [Leptolyngbya sp. 7M]